MTYKVFANRILFLHEQHDTKKFKPEKMVQNRRQVTIGKMAMKTINKSLFVQLKNKRFYFVDGIISFLEELRQYKKDGTTYSRKSILNVEVRKQSCIGKERLRTLK